MSEQQSWEEKIGLADSTTQVAFYCDEEHKDAWKTEASRQGYSSMSKYLYDLILEARSDRQQGFLSHHDSQDRIDELEVRVHELEEELDRE